MKPLLLVAIGALGLPFAALSRNGLVATLLSALMVIGCLLVVRRAPVWFGLAALGGALGIAVLLATGGAGATADDPMGIAPAGASIAILAAVTAVVLGSTSGIVHALPGTTAADNASALRIAMLVLAPATLLMPLALGDVSMLGWVLVFPFNLLALLINLGLAALLSWALATAALTPADS